MKGGGVPCAGSAKGPRPSKTWDFDNEVIAAANQLGIKLTSAEFGGELCKAWVDQLFDAGRMDECKAAIEAANAYASWSAGLH